MQASWIVKALVVAAILAQGLLGTPPSLVAGIGQRFVVPEGATALVAGAGLRISVHAVGLEWYVDGAEDIFAELTVYQRGRTHNLILMLGEPFQLDGVQIEMRAGEFGQSCTLLVTRD